MIVIVSETGFMGLEEPFDFKRFHLRIDAPSLLLAQMRARLVGKVRLEDADTAWVPMATVRQLARPDDADWLAGFAGMIAKAKPFGWIDEAGEAIRAHIVWRK